MLEPRSATGAPRAAAPRRRPHPSIARPSSCPPRGAVPAHVEADRREPGGRRRARHVGVVLLARAGAVQDHQPAPRLALGQVEQRGRGRRPDASCLRPIMAAATVVRLPRGLVRAGRPARDRRLRRGRARARVRHARLRDGRGRPARPRARVPDRAARPITTARAR